MIVSLLLLGVVLTVNIEREGSVDEMALTTTSGVVYQTLTIDGEEGVMVGKNQPLFLTRQDMKEMLEVLDGPNVIEASSDDDGDCLFFNKLTDTIEREDCEAPEEVKKED